MVKICETLECYASWCTICRLVFWSKCLQNSGGILSWIWEPRFSMSSNHGSISSKTFWILFIICSTHPCTLYLLFWMHVACTWSRHKGRWDWLTQVYSNFLLEHLVFIAGKIFLCPQKRGWVWKCNRISKNSSSQQGPNGRMIWSCDTPKFCWPQVTLNSGFTIVGCDILSCSGWFLCQLTSSLDKGAIPELEWHLIRDLNFFCQARLSSLWRFDFCVTLL